VNNTGWPTTRRHPRTLDEAFPDSRAQWCEGWQRPARNGWAGRLLAVLIGVLLAVVIVRHL
jgi:hypothetical protein